jgi:hypothetical protein
MTRFDARMTRRTFAGAAAAVSAGIAAGVPAGRAVLAQDASPVAAAAPGLPEGAIVVADGLVNPRFIVISDEGTLYVTENGSGGDEVVTPPVGQAGATPVAAEGTPAASEAPPEQAVTRGPTGQITQVTSDGTQSVLVSGLLSYSVGVGPVGLALGTGELFFDIGGAAVGAGFEPLPAENTVNRVNLETGEVTLIASLGEYEVENNPDGTDVNPNLYEIALNVDGQLLVNDAGGNAVYRVDPASGQFELVAVIPPAGQLPGGEGLTGADAERQPVPTALALGEGGSAFIGLLSEGWPQGAPSVLSLAADGSLGAVASGLAMLVGLTTGPDGHLYGSQLFGAPDASGMPGPGSVVRIYGDGTVEPVLENLPTPHGTAFDVAGNMYIAINSLAMGPGSPAGQVIRVDGVAAIG